MSRIHRLPVVLYCSINTMTTHPENPAISLRGSLGFTLVEMIAAITILLLLTTVALPVAVTAVKRQKELTLHRDLQTMRTAIGRYKDFCDRGMIPIKLDTLGYPPTLKTLVKGVPLKGSGVRYKFLRKIPVDPMTGQKNWAGGVRVVWWHSRSGARLSKWVG